MISVNIDTGEVSEAEDALHPVTYGGSASSLNRIVTCGGLQQSGLANFCQLYSPKMNRSVCLVLHMHF